MSKKKLELMYLGEQIGYTGEFIHLFIDKDKETYFFKKRPKYISFGDCIYVIKTKDGLQMSMDAKEIENPTLKPTKQQEREYEVRKLGNKYFREKKKKIADSKKPHGDIEKAISLIRPFTKKMCYLELERFFGYIKNQTTKGD